MAGLTQPLEFRRFLNRNPRPGFDFVPFLDFMAICLFVALNVSAFVIAPGTTIQLPSSAAMQAPKASPTAVLTVDRNELYFFEGAKLSPLTLGDHLKAHVASLDRAKGAFEPTLLVKADASIPTESLFQIMDMARLAGFTRIHLAAEPAGDGSADDWTAGLPEEGGP